MQNINILNELRRLIPGAERFRVVSALRQDNIVWQSLLQPDFAAKACSTCAGIPEQWTPAALAMLALNLPVDPSNLQVIQTTPLKGELRQRAARAYDALIKNNRAEKHNQSERATFQLAEAGLLALVLNEHLRASSWAQWSSILTRSEQIPLWRWQTPLSCFFGLIQQPSFFLRALLSPQASEEMIALALHAILSNPLTVETQFSLLKAVLHGESDWPGLSDESRLMLLRRLSEKNPQLAQELAKSALLEPAPSANNVQTHLQELDQLTRQAELHRLAGETLQALELLEQIRTRLLHLQAEFAARWATIAVNKNESSTGLALLPEKMILETCRQAGNLTARLPKDDQLPDYQARISLARLQLGDEEEINRQLVSPGTSAENMLFLARMLHQRGNQPEAREMALRCLARRQENHWLNQASSLSAGMAEELARLLLELDQPHASEQAAEMALERNPDNPQMLILLGKARQASNQPAKAAEAFAIAILLSDEQLDIIRFLADCLEASGEWARALQERSLLALRSELEEPEKNKTDLLALANCAFYASELEQAIHVSQQVLSTDPESGEASLIFGKSLLQRGDIQDGIDQLMTATTLIPDAPAPWLELARAYKQMSQPHKALETLRSGIQAAPHSAEIHLELSESLLEAKTPTQALNVLQRGIECIHNTPGQVPECVHRQILLRLGQTYALLGHYERSRQTLEQPYLQSSVGGKTCDYEIAYAYAQAMLALKNPHQALKPLKDVVASLPKSVAPYVDYAQTLLILRQEPGEAIQVLQQALTIAPDHLEAKGWLAEAYRTDENYAAALQTYIELMDSELPSDPTWAARLSLGLGHSALQLGQNETAVAALKEAVQADPKNPDAHRCLAEAFWAAHLYMEAWHAARTALQLEARDVDNLVWFADQVLRLFNLDEADFPRTGKTAEPSYGLNVEEALAEALEALSSAHHASAYPQVSFLVRLGRLQSLSGQNAAACETIRQALPNQQAHPAELEEAARLLLELGDVKSAILGLERARSLYIQQERAIPTGLFNSLVTAQRKIGNNQEALETLYEAIHLFPGDPSYYHQEADIFLELSQPEKAANILQIAASQVQEEQSILDLEYRLAQIWKANGDLGAAWHHADIAAAREQEICRRDPAQHLYKASLLASQLAWKLLNPKLALQYLKSIKHLPNLASSPDEAIPYCWQGAELALEAGEEIEAATFLTAALQANPQHPRSQAIQARLFLRQNDPTSAQGMFQEAIQQANSEPTRSSLQSADFLSLASAGAELQEWETTLGYAQQAITGAPGEPWNSFDMARLLVQQAEYQHLCKSLAVRTHSPGEHAVSSASRARFFQALQNAQKDLQASLRSLDPTTAAVFAQSELHLTTWERRGTAAFNAEHPSTAIDFEAWTNQISNADDAAACLAALRRASVCQPGYIESLAELYPNNAQVRIQVALCLAETDIVKALLQVKALADLPPGSYTNLPAAIFQALAASLAEYAGDTRAASQAIEIALSIWPDEPLWQVQAARLTLAAQEDTQNIQNVLHAAEHLEEAIKKDPHEPETYLALGQLYLETAQTDQTFWKQAIRTLEKGCRMAPDSAPIRLALAEAHLQNGSEKSLLRADACAQEATSLVDANSELVRQALRLRAEIALARGEAQDAFQLAEEMLQQQPDDQDSILIQAHALEMQNRPREALAALEKALPLSAEQLPLQIRQAILLRECQGLSLALQLVNKLYASYPEHPAVLSLLAQYQAEAGSITEAIQSAQQALHFSNGEINANEKARLHYLSGSLLSESGQLDNAIYHLNEAIHLAPKQVEPYIELGLAYQKQRQTRKAEYTYQQAIQAVPDDPRPYYHAGIMYRDTKKYEESVSMLRRASQLAPKDANVKKQLAGVMAITFLHKHSPDQEPNGSYA